MYEVEKLISVYKEHGKIIIGVDFDDTIYPFTKVAYIEARCHMLTELLKELRDVATLCLYTVAATDVLHYKEYIMQLKGIKPDFINESPVKLGDGTKPFFNILLDDKAGLNEAIKTLVKFKNSISTNTFLRTEF